MDVVILGNRIRELREARSLSRPELAAAAKLDRSDYWRIENGRIPVVGVKRLERIAKALAVEVFELLRPPEPRKQQAGNGQRQRRR